MLKSHLYDILEVPFPQLGMHQGISTHTLPFEYGAYLENILPLPLGEGRVRYGTTSMLQLEYGLRIEKIFSYPQKSQLLLYVRSFEKEGNIKQTWVKTPSSLEVTLKKGEDTRWYQQGTELKIIYEHYGTHEIIVPIKETFQEGNKTSLEFTDNSFPIAGEDIQIKEVFYSVGRLYLYDFKTRKTATLEAHSLAVHTQAQGTLYRGRLLITNGIDPVLMWDGTELTSLEELPRFKNLYAYKNRLWGTLSNPGEGMYAYFMKIPDALPEKMEAWGLDKTTKSPPFIDLSLKGIEDDEILHVRELGDKIIFFCKRHIQVWKGFNPLDPKDFIFERHINEGLLHADLTIAYANDILFMSPSGLRSLSSLNVGQQIAVTDMGKVGPFVQKAVSGLDSSNIKSCASFNYAKAGMLGFKIGNSPYLILLPQAEEKLITLFSGSFESANTCAVIQDRLYLARANELLLYEDGQSEIPCFHDEYQKEINPIDIKWVSPLITFKGKRYQGKRYQVNCEIPSSFLPNPKNCLSLKITGDVSARLDLQDQVPYYFHGDILGGHVSATYEKESNVLHLDMLQRELSGRSGFIARRFHVGIEGKIVDGPVNLSSVLLYGRREK